MDLFAQSETLPVAPRLPEIVAAARQGAAIVVAPPGSGKTTLVPPAVLDSLLQSNAGSPAARQVVLVQPRRLAARAVARRIASLRSVPLGEEVGYHVRFDRCASARTRLLVVTTGMLLRRLLDDESLTDVACVVLDEFHERTIDMDLALGMLQRVRETLRPDLSVVAMSATLDPQPVARLLGDCPVIVAEGRSYPVEIAYNQRPDPQRLVLQMAEAVRRVAASTPGHVLAFLPGVGEIVRCRDELASWAEAHDVQLHVLYGDLPAEQQDAALAPSSRQKAILATNVAETSLTIDGVTAVVDSGLARQLRFNPDVGLPRLELVPISQASAEQRAGRAGRTAPGRCVRLWEARTHRLRPASEPPEIARADLSETLLRLRLWGERDVAAFPWLDPPPEPAVAAAEQLLKLLGALDDQGIPTTLGRRLGRLPAHPRLSRLLVAGAALGALREATVAAALLGERDPFTAAQRDDRGPRDRGSDRTRSDVADRVATLQEWHATGRRAGPALEFHPGAARRVLQAAEQLYREADFPQGPRAADPYAALCRALLAAFPDRVARLRTGAEDRGLLVGGKGVRLTPPSRVRGEPLVVAVDLHDAAGEARARMASAIDREWLVGPLVRTADEVFFNPTRQQVEARRRTYWIDLLLDETPTSLEDAAAAAELLAQHARQRLASLLPDDKDPAARFRARAAWLAQAAPELALPALDEPTVAAALPQLCAGLRSLEQLRQAPWLAFFQGLVGYERLAEIDRLAPEALVVPSGNRHALTYAAGRPPVLAVRIQEVFGWSETPRVAGGRVPVLLHLLGPNYRPQQITDDLASFWRNTYPEVRKELRRRYPKHAWPEDPTTAAPSRSGLPRKPG